MTNIDKIRKFLSGITDISFGYNEINFSQPDYLDEEQIGFSVDSDGNSLVTDNNEDWREEWLVIATDQLGDPIIVDISSHDLKVLSATHGEGEWIPFVISNSLENFKKLISILHDVSKNRTNPVELEKHPLTDKERQKALAKIQEQNPDAEIWFWENFFENN